MGRSQRHLRYNHGYDSNWDPAYFMGEPSLVAISQQYSAVDNANGPLFPPSGCIAAPINALVGSTFTCTDGTWLPPAGPYTKQWFVEDKLIQNATGNSYTFAVPDLGRLHSCRVVAKSGDYQGFAFSNAVKAV